MPDERPIYHDRIVSDPRILVGKPTVRGTRIPVELVLEYLERNPNFEGLFADYPRLTMDDVRACLAYARDHVERAQRGTTDRRHSTAQLLQPPRQFLTR